jgi:hypothetical protein
MATPQKNDHAAEAGAAQTNCLGPPSTEPVRPRALVGYALLAAVSVATLLLLVLVVVPSAGAAGGCGGG